MHGQRILVENTNFSARRGVDQEFLLGILMSSQCDDGVREFFETFPFIRTINNR